MAGRLRKTLPRDFGELVESGDVPAMKAVLERCARDARDGSGDPALSCYGVPDELVRWLVERGADLEAANRYGETPLHHHAGAWNGNPALLLELGAELESRDSRGRTALFRATRHPAHVRTLLAAGAEVDACDPRGCTPLLHVLAEARPADISATAATAALLIEAGARVSERMAGEVARLGKEFEHFREVFNPELLDETDAALSSLYALFEVEPAPARVRHDGAAPIAATAEHVADRYRELWELLVPPMGAAKTVQGEVVRIAGRVGDEIDRNGGVNWDEHYRAMLDALPGHLASGTPLPAADLTAARTLAADLRSGDASPEELSELRALVVRWVDLNPAPLALPAPAYQR